MKPEPAMDIMDEHITIPSGYVMLPHGMGLAKISSPPDITGKTLAGDTGKARNDCQPDNASQPDDTGKAEMGGKRNTDNGMNAASKVVENPVQGRYSLRRRQMRSAMGPGAQPDIKSQSKLLLKVDKASVTTKVDDKKVNKADPAHTTTIPTTTIEHQEVRRKRIPRKDQSPYQRHSTVPWGETPFPEHDSPTAAQCQHVFDLLKEQHANGKLNFVRPAKIPPPSLDVAGCGETPLLIDGLARTILSGSTSMKNANNAIQQVVDCYGTITKSAVMDGQVVTPVKNCIDWDRVRREGVAKFGEVIKCGGLQNVGSKAVLSILETTHAINTKRAAAFRQEKETEVPITAAAAAAEDDDDSYYVPDGADALTQSQKDMEIWMHDNGVVSLEHLRALPAAAVMDELVQLHGVGVKTAACVILFCLQEPCFAVDTHCFRLPQWLGWLPARLYEGSDRSRAFAHLDLRVPDDLKYGLHQLFIEHGQNCYRCRAVTREGSAEWEKCVCPLEALLDRSITKKAGKAAAAGRKRKVAKIAEAADDEGAVKEEEGRGDGKLGEPDGVAEEVAGEIVDSVEQIIGVEPAPKKAKKKNSPSGQRQKQKQKVEEEDGDDEDYLPNAAPSEKTSTRASTRQAQAKAKAANSADKTVTSVDNTLGA